MPLDTIKKRADFLLANSSAKRFITGSFILQLQQRAPTHPAGKMPRFGFTVTKKMGGAVIRNRIKRRLREAVRAAALPYVREGYDYILISRHKALTCTFAELVRDMEFAFSKIHSMKDSPIKRR